MSDEETQKLAMAIGQALAQVNTVRSEVPGVLKWAAGIVSALLVMAVGGSGAWLINSVNDMQQTLTALDERSKAAVQIQDLKVDDNRRRIEALETDHRDGGQ